MTDAITIIPGQRIGAWEILSIDPTGKRCVVGCACGGTHVYSTEALLSGSAACGAIPTSRESIARMRAEADERRRRHDRDWRPGDRTP